jgi:DNA processing protein
MAQIKTLKLEDKEYPELLKKIYDPPDELYVKGDIQLLSSRCIAIVGTRTATRYGKEIARKFARELADVGITIVSGLAEGIDTEAHVGALEGNGRTVAVFGCGLDKVFPAQNVKLAEKIEKNGALVSELPAGHPTAKWTFPRRNRIISGLSIGVIMVEGHYDSGAMITAKHAIDEGREVFAVPGNVELDQTKGPHWLIKQGAKLVENVDDVLEEFNIKRVAGTGEKKEKDYSDLSFDEAEIIKNLTREPKHVDEISVKCDMDAGKVLGLLSVLEIKGIVKQLPGKYFVIS